MQVVLLNEKFESVTIYDISLLQTVTEIQLDDFFNSFLFGESKEYVIHNYNKLVKLSFSFGIIQDIEIGLPKCAFNAIIEIIKGIMYNESDNCLNVKYTEIKTLLQTVKSDLSAFLLQAKKDAIANESNECRAFFTEKYVKEFLEKVESIKVNLFQSENEI